ncbi:unnamed protein product, partial [Adineta steineri]
MNIYIRKSTQNDVQQRFRFPVARYTRREFPLPGPFINFMPWIPIFADRLTRQTIIYSSTGGNEELYLQKYFLTDLIIDPQKKEACGVEYIKGANLYKASSLASQTPNSNQLKKSSVYAKCETIVSGRQWMTPQLLQLSGIGDKDLLKQFGIPVIQDLPGVGINQQDRSEGVYVVKLKPNVDIAGIRSINCTYNATLDDPCLIDYIKHPQTALYASNDVLFAILHSTKPKLPKLPDTVFLFLPNRFTGFRANWVNESLQYPVGAY